jgi:carbonic anhydrase
MMTPDEALERLMRGNGRFAAGVAANPNQTVERRAQVAGGQMPFAVMLGCSDSRVPLEIIFDQGLGDLFVVRVPGNIFDDNIVLGSLEFAAQAFQSPLLMVLGHEKCGAVAATIEAVQGNTTLPGKVANIFGAIKPVVELVKDKPGNLWENAVRANVMHVTRQLSSADSFITKRQADGALKIVGAVYSLDLGKVEIIA